MTNELKHMMLYSSKRKFCIPIDEKDKRKGSAILLLTPNLDASVDLVKLPYVYNPNYYRSFYIDRNVMAYIDSAGIDAIEDEEDKFDEVEEEAMSEALIRIRDINKSQIVFHGTMLDDTYIIKKVINLETIEHHMRAFGVRKMDDEIHVHVYQTTADFKSHLPKRYNDGISSTNAYTKGNHIHILSPHCYDEKTMDGPYNMYLEGEVICYVIQLANPRIDDKLRTSIAFAMSGQADYFYNKYKASGDPIPDFLSLSISIGNVIKNYGMGPIRKLVRSSDPQDLLRYVGRNLVFRVFNITETTLTGKDRRELKSTDFGLPDKKKYPMPDADHVKAAIRLFNHVDPEDEERLAKAIKVKMKKFGVKAEIGEKNRLSKYINESFLEEIVEAAIDTPNEVRPLGIIQDPANESWVSNLYTDVVDITKQLSPDEFKLISFHPDYQDSPYIVYRDVIYDDNMGNPIAFMDVYQFTSNPDCAQITTATVPSHRGKGLCKRLLNRLLSNKIFANDRCIKKFIWNVVPDNYASISVCRTNGFNMVDDKLDKYGRHQFVKYTDTTPLDQYMDEGAVGYRYSKISTSRPSWISDDNIKDAKDKAMKEIDKYDKDNYRSRNPYKRFKTNKDPNRYDLVADNIQYASGINNRAQQVDNVFVISEPRYTLVFLSYRAKKQVDVYLMDSYGGSWMKKIMSFDAKINTSSLIKQSLHDTNTINEASKKKDKWEKWTGKRILHVSYEEAQKIMFRFPKSEHNRVNGKNFIEEYSPFTVFLDAKYVTVDGEKYGGYINVFAFDNDPHYGIVDIGVEPKARGKGISDALVRRAINECPSIGINHLIWKCDKDNEPSIKLAKRNGFKPYKVKEENGQWVFVYDMKPPEEDEEEEKDKKDINENVQRIYNFNTKLPTEDELISESTILNEVESKYDKRIKRYLYKERLRTNRQVITIYNDLRPKLAPKIKFMYPRLKMYRNMNLYIDLSYYNSIFLKKITYKRDRAINMYFDFINRSINNPDLASYKNQTIFVPIDPGVWEVKPGTDIYDFKQNLNPLSIMYRMLRTNPDALKKEWGGRDILFLGKRGYFKVDFTRFSLRDMTKFRNNIKRLQSMSEPIIDEDEPDGSIADQREDKDSTKAIITKSLDKIENKTGIKIDNIEVLPIENNRITKGEVDTSPKVKAPHLKEMSNVEIPTKTSDGSKMYSTTVIVMSPKGAKDKVYTTVTIQNLKDFHTIIKV